ncbi:MAG: helix-turn-helix transcriptional regulator [Bacillota bacterium]
MRIDKIGKFILMLRQEKGITQKELAEKLDVTNKAVSKWETGKGMPDSLMLIPLSNIFNVSVNELLLGERIVKEEFVPKSNQTIVSIIKIAKRNRNIAIVGMAVLILLLFVTITLIMNMNTYGGYDYLSYYASSERAGMEADIIFIKDKDLDVYEYVYIELTCINENLEITHISGTCGTAMTYQDEDGWGVIFADYVDDGWSKDDVLTFMLGGANFSEAQLSEFNLTISTNLTSGSTDGKGVYQMSISESNARLNNKITSMIK